MTGDANLRDDGTGGAIAAALLSAREDHPLPAETVFFGELSLSGALRARIDSQSRLALG